MNAQTSFTSEQFDTPQLPPHICWWCKILIY